MPYQPNIPTGSVPLNQDYANLLGNFQSLDTSFGVDHTPFSNLSDQNGYHTAIHFIPVSSGNPNIPPTGYTNTPGFAQLFTATTNDGIATDQTLFYDSGTGNNLTQMTMNFTPVRGSNGYTFLPGRILYQWGIATILAANISVNVLFATSNIDFPRFVYNIQLTYFVSDSDKSNRPLSVRPSSLSLTGFQIQGGGSVANQQVYWTAIGS